MSEGYEVTSELRGDRLSTAINATRSVQYDGVFLPGIVQLTLCDDHRGTRMNPGHVEFLGERPLRHNPPPKGVNSRKVRCVFIFYTGTYTKIPQNNMGERPTHHTGTVLYITLLCCVCFLPFHSGHQVRWTYQPGSYRRKVTQDFSSSTFFLRCVP